MNNDIVKELTTLDEVELIYSNTKNNDGVTTLTYNIICDVNNIVDNIKACKKIIAVMEILKELVTKYGVRVDYNIKTSDTLDEEIDSNNKRIINELAKADILYAKSEYFNEKVNSKRK